ncbi:MAG: hypothetical protein WD208_10005 [Dehalococcoidia bacterium]
MTQTAQQRTAALTKHLLAQHMLFAGLLCAGFAVAVASLIVGVAIFRGISVSGWEQAATQVPRWYVLFIGVHFGYSVLPIHVAHGKTRRSVAQLIGKFLIAFSAFGALLMVLGFVLEAGLYQLAGWPQALSLSHLFTSPGELHLVLIEYWLRFLVWGAAGALLGAAFYRDGGLGGIVIPPVILLMAVAEMALSPADWWPFGSVPPFMEDLGLGVLPLPVSMVVPLLGALLIGGLGWLVIRDVPLRNKGA